jgi:hypothetical protein
MSVVHIRSEVHCQRPSGRGHLRVMDRSAGVSSTMEN